MKYYLDTEFHEYKKQPKVLGVNVGKPIDTIELISIGIVAEDGREYYAICNEFDLKAAWNDEWLRENVLKDIHKDLNQSMGTFHKTYYSETTKWSYKGMKRLLKWAGKTKLQIANEIVEFIYGTSNNLDGLSHLQESQKYEINNKSLNPTFYAYYADYDWVVFCWLFGRMIDLPEGFPMYCRDLKQELDSRLEKYSSMGMSKIVYPEVSHNVFSMLGEQGEGYKEHVIKDSKKYPKQENEHNALADAKWNKELHEFITNVKL